MAAERSGVSFGARTKTLILSRSIRGGSLDISLIREKLSQRIKCYKIVARRLPLSKCSILFHTASNTWIKIQDLLAFVHIFPYVISHNLISTLTRTRMSSSASFCPSKAWWQFKYLKLNYRQGDLPSRRASWRGSGQSTFPRLTGRGSSPVAWHHGDLPSTPDWAWPGWEDYFSSSVEITWNSSCSSKETGIKEATHGLAELRSVLLAILCIFSSRSAEDGSIGVI